MARNELSPKPNAARDYMGARDFPGSSNPNAPTTMSELFRGQDLPKDPPAKGLLGMGTAIDYTIIRPK